MREHGGISMGGRTAFKATIAFCAALVAGHCLFHTNPQQDAAKSDLTQPNKTADVVQVSSPATPVVAAAPIAAKPSAINQDLKVVDGGVSNDNLRMSHFISNQYAEGTLHKTDA